MRVDIPALPRMGDVIRLNSENFVVTVVAHALDEGIESYYLALVYLDTANNYFKEYDRSRYGRTPRP